MLRKSFISLYKVTFCLFIYFTKFSNKLLGNSFKVLRTHMGGGVGKSYFLALCNN